MIDRIVECIQNAGQPIKNVNIITVIYKLHIEVELKGENRRLEELERD